MRREPSLRERALRLLARREHSRAELARKLREHTRADDDLEALLEDLSRHKLLSDERYAESRAHALSRKFGAARIAHELRAKGLATDLADTARTEGGDKDEAAKERKTARVRRRENASEDWRRR